MNEIESSDEKWELRKGDFLIGVLEVYYKSDYWLTANFTPIDKFEQYREAFRNGHFYNNNINTDNWSFEQRREQISEFGIHLIRLSDQAVSRKFILHIKDERADFRFYLT